MTQEERFKIISEEYADFIIEYRGNEVILERFNNYTIHIMNDREAVIYVPVAEIGENSLRMFGYSAIPNCFGMVSEQSLSASGVLRIRNHPAFNLRGQGVLIGVVDSGIDYTNPVFFRMDGTTKIISIWDQTIDSENGFPPNTFYGTEYHSEQINQALASANPLEVVPSIDEIGHGTMIAGIAAGAEDEVNNFSGVVPDSDLVVVKLKQAKNVIRDVYVLPYDVPCYQENDIMWGVQYLISVARKLQRPIAICIGLGTSLASHDGRDTLSSHLSIVGDFPGVTITVAAGNEGNARKHFFGTINAETGVTTVELNVGENERGFAMQLWGAPPSTYSIDILSPSGEYIPRIAESLIVNRDVSFLFEQTQISIDYSMVETETGHQLIFMRFRNPTPGIWRFQVYGRGDIPGTFHIWLPLSSFISNSTYFVQPNPYTTITSPGNAVVPITVTAYNPNNDTLYLNSGKGFTRTGIIKPELAAPGVGILSPTLEHGFTEVTGTSAAAAHTTGITAMLLEWGTVRGNYAGLDTVEVKKFLIRGAKRSQSLLYPNRDWGYGIIDIFNVFDTLRSSLQFR